MNNASFKLQNSEDFSSTCALPHRDFPKLVLWYDLEEKEEKNGR